jgi:hypothetical protein
MLHVHGKSNIGDLVISSDSMINMSTPGNRIEQSSDKSTQKNSKHKSRSEVSPKNRSNASSSNRNKGNEEVETKALLHSGDMLGDLPALGSTGSSSGTKYRSPTGNNFELFLRRKLIFNCICIFICTI